MLCCLHRNSSRGYVPDIHPILPSIALTNTNRRPIAPLELYRVSGVLALHGRTPLPDAPNLIASRTYNVRRILVALAEMVAEMKLHEQACMIFLDGLPTVNRSSVCHKNRVLCEDRAQGGGIAVVECLVNLLRLALSCSIICGSSVFVCWEKVGEAKLIANPTRANDK